MIENMLLLTNELCNKGTKVIFYNPLDLLPFQRETIMIVSTITKKRYFCKEIIPWDSVESEVGVYAIKEQRVGMTFYIIFA